MPLRIILGEKPPDEIRDEILRALWGHPTRYHESFMSEYDDWKQENDRWEAYLYPNGVLRNKLGITKAAKWHKMERDFGTTSRTRRILVSWVAWLGLT